MLITQVEKLSQVIDKYCVSVYLPKTKFGVQTFKQQLREKLGTTIIRLLAAGMSKARIHAYLRQSFYLLRDPYFLQRFSEKGVALFIGGRQTNYLEAPENASEQIVINNCFYLQPFDQLISRQVNHKDELSFQKLKLVLNQRRLEIV